MHQLRKSIIYSSSMALTIWSGTICAQLNETQNNFFDASFQSWMAGSMSGKNSVELQEATDRIFHMGSIQSETDSSIVAVSAEQSNVFGSQSTKTLAGQLHTVDVVHKRLKLASNEQSDVLFAGNNQVYAINRGGAASSDIGGKLGFWMNGSYSFGDNDSTFNQLGYDYDSWSTVLGVDYKLTNQMIVGLAFDYSNIDANFDGHRGGSDTDSYSGSIYSSYFITDNFHLDAVASYGGSDYEINRKLFYVITTGPLPGTVDTVAEGETDGDQLSFNFNAGYNFSYEGLSIAPYASVNYLTMQIDSFKEDKNTGDGWAMGFNEQNIRSLTTTVGSQASYAISVPFGVVIPQIHGAWHHEYKNDGRTAKATLLGDALAQTIDIDIAGPDRDFYTVGADVAAVLTHGVTTFASYNALVGYNNVDSHTFTLGFRLEL